MSEFQFGLADLFCATLGVSVALAGLLRLSESPGDHWLIVVLSLICTAVGIAFSHTIYSDARYHGGTGTAVWTTLLGVVIGIAGAPIILIALPLVVLLGMIVAVLVTLELGFERASKRLALLFGKTRKPAEPEDTRPQHLLP